MRRAGDEVLRRNKFTTLFLQETILNINYEKYEK